MTASMDVDDMEEGGTLYTFEGTDYAQEPSTADKKAFDDLMSGECVKQYIPSIWRW